MTYFLGCCGNAAGDICGTSTTEYCVQQRFANVVFSTGSLRLYVSRGSVFHVLKVSAATVHDSPPSTSLFSVFSPRLFSVLNLKISAERTFSLVLVFRRYSVGLLACVLRPLTKSAGVVVSHSLGVSERL